MGMIECRECKAHISDTAKSCPQCGYTGRQKKPTSLVVWVAGIFMVSCTVVAVLPNRDDAASESPSLPAATHSQSAAISTTPSATAEELLAEVKKAVEDRSPGIGRSSNAKLQKWYAGSMHAVEGAKLMKDYEDRLDAEAKKAEENRSDWQVTANTDEMTGKRNVSTTIASEGSFDLGFPYDGPQKANLIVRQHSRYGLDVIVSIERGQISCTSYRDCSVEVRFDDGAVETFSAAGPQDNSTELIFIRNTKRFIAALKKSRSVKIVLPIYQHGGIVHSFRTVGFDLK